MRLFLHSCKMIEQPIDIIINEAVDYLVHKSTFEKIEGNTNHTKHIKNNLIDINEKESLHFLLKISDNELENRLLSC